MVDDGEGTPPGTDVDDLPVDPDVLPRAALPRWDVLAVIAAGGAVGSLGRWGLTLLLPHPAGAFPWATFAANTAGCALLGVLMVFVVEMWPPSRYARPFLGVGVLGGFTTFSTFMLDARSLLVAGRTAPALAYVAGSLAAGLAAVVVGIRGTRLAVRRDRTHGPAAPVPGAGQGPSGRPR